MWRPWCGDESAGSSENCVVEPEDEDESGGEDHNSSIKPGISGRGHHLSKGQQAAVLAMLEYAKEKGASNPVSDVVKVLGVSKSSVYSLKSKAICSPKKRGPSHGKFKFRRVDDFHWKMLQRTIYENFSKNEVPTVRSLHQAMKLRDPEFNYSERHLYRMVKALGFKFKKLDRRGKIMLSQRIVFLRDKYLTKIKKLRDDRRRLIFLDETWYDTHDVVKRGWTDDTLCSTLDAPPSRGKRIIILHAGYEGGWVPGALLIAAKNIKNAAADYHQDMDGDLFETWCEKTLIPSLASTFPDESCAIIMDNAAYHSRLLYATPSKKMKKEEIIETLTRLGIPIPELMTGPNGKQRKPTKDDLLNLYKDAGVEKQYKIDNLVQQHGHSVVRLPPYYCIYNPIELVWAELKRNVRRFNTTPSLSAAVIQHIRDAVNNINGDLWKKCCDHARKEEEKTRVGPALIEPFIISVADEDDEDESENEIGGDFDYEA